MAKGSGFSKYSVLLSSVLFASALTALPGCASRGVPANLDHQTENASGTALYRAAADGDFEAVSALTKSGAPLNTLTGDGTPLMAAVHARADRIAWYLLSKGAAPDLAETNKITPLMVASGQGDRRLVRLLLSAGARVNAMDVHGSTAVMRAAEQGQLSVVKVLLAAGANVNVSQGGESLLMKVVSTGDLLTAEMLLAAGADVNYRAKNGASALDLARARNHQDLEMLLVQAGAEL
ncbi:MULTISPECIES: ankyrin repeat domain-containing protein [unclassified Marinobacter]|uniref:ankyrin repeat domain-containing protein n=1 Tax=unclassified Marinobacter TaxID=83889 RepID=UPI0026E20375|nr:MULTISPECIES: ankyrin repeat domain-containing protein [unclassified Marinobacter]MDO6441526.1 ankyrin repeat domain-containing protein [Marinobacter sp. 2_MG-2023]MDO6822311.1 ankyrin repeat domain-containing protein [Marinobacter sp. 1_MG-2023]